MFILKQTNSKTFHKEESVKKQTLTILALATFAIFMIGAATMAGDGCPYSASKDKAKAEVTTAAAKATDGETITLSVSNMTCGSCVNHVTKTLSEVEGVKDVTVSLEKGTAEVICDAGKVKGDELAQVVTKAGYPTKLAVATETVETSTATKASHKCASTCGSKAKKNCDPSACGNMKTAAKSEGDK
jgi:copper chaperone CopZ